MVKTTGPLLESIGCNCDMSFGPFLAPGSLGVAPGALEEFQGQDVRKRSNRGGPALGGTNEPSYQATVTYQPTNQPEVASSASADHGSRASRAGPCWPFSLSLGAGNHDICALVNGPSLPIVDALQRDKCLVSLGTRSDHIKRRWFSRSRTAG